ncbi:MAG: formate dehydrogenase accessory protein FdhE [Pyrobaculum sp.]
MCTGEELLSLICDNCDDLLREVEAIASAAPVEYDSAFLQPPLIKYKEGEELETYRRAIYLSRKYGDVFKGWRGDFCPICGLRPVLFIFREVDVGTYSKKVRYAKCSCGFTWEYGVYKCPNCGVVGKENFTTYIKNCFIFYKCNNCNFTFVEITKDVDKKTELLARIAARYVAES